MGFLSGLLLKDPLKSFRGTMRVSISGLRSRAHVLKVGFLYMQITEEEHFMEDLNFFAVATPP